MHQKRPALVFIQLCCLISLLLAACGDPPDHGTIPQTPTIQLQIFAAASLTEAFTDLKAAYQRKHADITITYNFAGTQTLWQQMAQGATPDLFASADLAYMQQASEAGLVEGSKIFAHNKLTVLLPASNPGHIQSLKDLARPGLKIDMAAASVPVGKYALEVLDKLANDPEYGPDYEKNVKANIVSQEENVKAVVQKVLLGEVDAGVVYATDVSSVDASKVTSLAIPDHANVIADYPLAVTKKSAHTREAQAFEDYILSPDGQATLQKYHFLPASV